MDDVKSKPLCKPEIDKLLDLIESSPVIMNRSVDASTNIMKNQDWERITELFNSSTSIERTSHQLRLKWENLKKNARRRNKMKVINSSHPPQNRILERVSTILNENIEPDGTDPEAKKSLNKAETRDLHDLIENSKIIRKKDSFKVKKQEWNRITETFNSLAKKRKHQSPKQLWSKWEKVKNDKIPISVSIQSDTDSEDSDQNETLDRVRSLLHTPSNETKVTNDSGHTSQDRAISEYYKFKKRYLEAKLELEMEKALLENERIRLEQEKLRVEIENLKK